MINNTAICDSIAEGIAENIKDTFTSAQQIVFIDSQVEDYQLLAAGVLPSIEVVVLKSDRNGIEQITEALSQRTDFTTIHLVSHGSPGCLYLGNTNLSLDTLNQYEEKLRSWFNLTKDSISASLAPQFWVGEKNEKSPKLGERPRVAVRRKGMRELGFRGLKSVSSPTLHSLLIYGCNVAAGDAGEEFITKLHNLTSAEIAASTTRIGNASLDGNWELNYQTYELAPRLAFGLEVQKNYAGILEELEEDKNPVVSDLVEDLTQELVEDLPSVTTDKDDYPPGSTAIITGTDFQPGETIELQVLHTDDIPNTGGGHDPWLVTDGGKDDLDGKVDGNFETTWYVNPDDSANSAFEVTATGLSLGEVATNTFTDTVSTVTYENTATGNITNGTTLTKTFNVTQDLFISNVTFGFNATHTNRGDIRVVLTSPTGTSVIILNNSSDTNNNYDLLVQDGSANAINDGNADTTTTPFYGSDRIAAPSNPFSAFAGQSSLGTWTVAITDQNNNGTNGSYNRSQLNITGDTDPTISGTAFIDYNNDGTQQPSNSAAEVGLSGITVNAYNSAGTQVASATTNSSGQYSFTVTKNTPVRVEFSNLPSGYVEGKSSKSVFFVDGTSNVTQNLGLLDPNRYINGVPRLITPCYVLGSSTGSTQPAIISVLHTDSGQAPASERIDTTIGKVGSVNGLAYQKQTGDLFAGAFQKRFSDVLGTDGNGKIYRIANLNDANVTTKPVSTFINLSDFFDPNTDGDNNPKTNPVAGAYAHTAADIGTIDAASFDKVGKVALGDVEISEDRKYIWTINLADRKLYKIQVGSNSDPTKPVDYVAGDTRTINSYNILGDSNTPSNGGIALNQLGLNPTGNIRPFALAEKDGLVYVGMVNSAQFASGNSGTSGAATDLRAYVYTFDPNTPSAGFTKVLDFNLNYARGNKVDFPTPKQPADWDPWTDTHGGTGGTDGLNFQREGTTAKYWALRTQPILSDIDFDNNGDIIVGLRDRTADQVGDQSKDLTGAGNYNAGSGGDILRASKTGTNQWTIEPSVTDTDTNLTTNPEFYKQEEYNPGVADTYDHFETAQGGITQIPGYVSTETTALDPVTINSGGIIGLNNTTGNQTRGIQLYANNGINKANGLGDLEYLGEVAPIEIGNRIWNDTNTNGIQDAGESGINAVTVNLYNSAGTQVGTTTTNASGEYYFNNTNVNLNGASGLLPNTNYSIRLDTAANYNSGQPLNGKNVTLSNQGNNDEIDSDAVISGGFPRITLTTGDYGENNHSYDFGFTTTSKDYGDAPDGTSGNSTGDYTTTLANGGASHTIVNNLSIGSTVDSDSGTLQNTAATADNIDGTNDEDGVASFSPLKTDDGTYSVSVNVTNTVGAANLIGWIDFNQDGIFQSTEAATATVANSAGVQTKVLNWSSIPANTKAGTTYARFRLSTDAALTTSYSTGAATNGEVEDYQLTVAGVDYGDAPDAATGTGVGNYKTTKADGGASHTIVSGLSIGATIDGDSGTLQNTAATADDTTNNGTANDEDGVASFSPLKTDDGTYSVSVNVTNTVGAANLIGWIDFNQDGIFQSTEAATATVANSAGVQTKVLNWSSIPANTKAGTTYARFRLSTDAALTTSYSTGAATNGEVEDYQLTVAGVDYGDAPDAATGTGVGNYKTTKADGGASHTIVSGLSIGATIDGDSGTLQNTAATADDTTNNGTANDEDGVASFSPLKTDDGTYSVSVNVTNTVGAANLIGWIDFNQDGIFQSTEAATATVANSAGVQTKVLNWSSIPANTKAGTTYARFRLSTDAALTTSYSTGAATNGEVEDYQLTVAGVDYGDAPDAATGTGVGNYKTTKADGGASHTIVSGLSIGATIDGDSGTLQNTAATADDTTNNGTANDEDGVASFSPLKTDDGTYSVSVNVTNTVGAANLIGWIDFNQDGIFQSTEAATATVANSAGVQTKVLNWSSIPANTKAGTTYARFRLSTDAALTTSYSTGAATNGEVEDYQLTVAGVDYGDAPDAATGTGVGNYKTTKADGGASHTIVSGLSIGATIDGDSGTLQNTAATADDTTNNGTANDEDGVASFSPLKTDDGTYSVSVNVTNTVGAANLIGWIDFNQDGIFQSTEAATATVANSAGVQTKVLNWSSIPANTKAGTTYARFRLSTDAALTTSYSTGAATNGEVEDYQLTVAGVDYGDAPDAATGTGVGNYKTTKADGGASHTIVSGLSIGATIDGDSGTLQNTAATADDTTNNGTANDEDGVASFSPLKTDDGTYSVSVNVTNTVGAANLIGWIDFNQDGIFQSTEAATATVANSAGVQTKVLNWSSIPANTKAGTTYARFRLSTDAALTTSYSTGAATNGEVEDYQLTVAGVDYGDAPDAATGTGVGNYKTTKADGGASHTIVSGLSIGATIDGDSGTLQNTAATADDTTNNGAANDEDGVTKIKTNGKTYTATVNVNNTTGTSANLLGWIDFNQNGVFDASEAASSVQTVAANSGATTQTLTWNSLPSDIQAGTTYARFRLGTDTLTNASSVGALGNGEVEDYQIKIKNNVLGTGSPEVINTTTTIKTTAGDDLIVGGKGEDTLTGGAGNDCFYFNETSEGVDTIKDFTKGQDKIDISNILANEVVYTGSNPIGDGYLKLVSLGASTIVQIDFNPLDAVYPKDIAFLEGVTGVTAADFII